MLSINLDAVNKFGRADAAIMGIRRNSTSTAVSSLTLRVPLHNQRPLQQLRSEIQVVDTLCRRSSALPIGPNAPAASGRESSLEGRWRYPASYAAICLIKK